MDQQLRQTLRGYAIGVGSVAVAAALRFALAPFLGDRLPSSPFLIAIMFACRFGGYGPSWLALALGAIPVAYFQLTRDGAFDAFNPASQTAIAVYLALGTLIILLAKSERHARHTAERSAADALDKQRLLEREIAEREAIEQQLRERQQQLELALQAGSLGIWSWDVKTDQVRSTETQAVIHGRSPDQTQQAIADSLGNVYADDREFVKDALERALRGEASERVTYRTQWPDSSIHWVESIGKVFVDESGRPNRVLGVSMDVTEKKKAEIALREAEERFRLLAVHAPVGIAQSDAEGKVFFVNPKWCEIAGADPAEALGFGWLNSLHSDDRERLLEAWRQDIAAGKIYGSPDFRFVRKDGTIRWASSTVSLVRDASGKPIGQIGITEDVTKRKAAEDALRTKETQLRGILDNASAVIYLKDLLGRYVLVNHRFRMLFRRLGDDVIGKTDLEWFPKAIGKAFMEVDGKVMREQSPIVAEEVALHEDGPHIYRSVKFPVKDDAGKLIAVGGISTDITDLKDAHEALKKQEALLRNLIEVQENEKRFLCHEFHDGLIQYAVGALFLLEGVQPRAAAEDSATIETVIGQLRKGVEDGRRVIRGIRPAVLDDSNVEAAIHDLIDQFSTSGILVTFACDPDIGRLPESVQTTIYRVVQEALNNAKKHSGTDVVRVELRKSNGELRLEIRDFGCGFDVKSARSRGFGLLGMTERVRLLGGECSITSEKDAGTTITARLPIPTPQRDAG